MCVYEYGLRSTDENPRVGDMVEVYLRQTRKEPKGRPVTKSINENIGNQTNNKSEWGAREARRIPAQKGHRPDEESHKTYSKH